MKKNGILIVFGIIAIVILSITVLYCINANRKKADSEYQLQTMYKWQNKAFGLGNNNDDKIQTYIGANELDLKLLFVSLYRYSMDEPNSELTIQEVVDYLSKEYAYDGTLMIYSQPESISDYIEWWSEKDGSKKVTLFIADIAGFLSQNGYDSHDYETYSIEELQEILPLVEKAKDDQ
ncbi:hypothetical protein [Butyrivibrio proteoclasticus]|uniref:hypothetical protein n=1 Tax=Butyrivibrio proteoclasticus TaxID=43305 RepID=UPI00047A85DC|nr:hypothetical protein [Butyrivibrio proteoclasticus]